MTYPHCALASDVVLHLNEVFLAVYHGKRCRNSALIIKYLWDSTPFWCKEHIPSYKIYKVIILLTMLVFETFYVIVKLNFVSIVFIFNETIFYKCYITNELEKIFIKYLQIFKQYERMQIISFPIQQKLQKWRFPVDCSRNYLLYASSAIQVFY